MFLDPCVQLLGIERRPVAGGDDPASLRRRSCFAHTSKAFARPLPYVLILPSLSFRRSGVHPRPHSSTARLSTTRAARRPTILGYFPTLSRRTSAGTGTCPPRISCTAQRNLRTAWRRNGFASIATTSVISGPSLLPAGRARPRRRRPTISPLPHDPRHPAAHDGLPPHFPAAIPRPSSRSAPVQAPFPFPRVFAGPSRLPPSSSGVRRPSSFRQCAHSPHPWIERVGGERPCFLRQLARRSIRGCHDILRAGGLGCPRRWMHDTATVPTARDEGSASPPDCPARPLAHAEIGRAHRRPSVHCPSRPATGAFPVRHRPGRYCCSGRRSRFRAMAHHNAALAPGTSVPGVRPIGMRGRTARTGKGGR